MSSQIVNGILTPGLTNSSGGSVPTATFLDYLRPEVSRPDIYEERSFLVKDLHGPNPKDRRDKSKPNTNKLGTLLYTIGVIILSALIFVTIIAWVDVLRSWFDSKYVNSIISIQTKSRIYFSITITIIALIIGGFLVWFWLTRSHVTI